MDHFHEGCNGRVICVQGNLVQMSILGVCDQKRMKVANTAEFFTDIATGDDVLCTRNFDMIEFMFFAQEWNTNIAVLRRSGGYNSHSRDIDFPCVDGDGKGQPGSWLDFQRIQQASVFMKFRAWIGVLGDFLPMKKILGLFINVLH
jgi:hypothetical protein